MPKRIFVSGSLAYDRIMDFPGRFADLSGSRFAGSAATVETCRYAVEFIIRR